MKKLLLIILLFWLTLAPVAQAENITKATFAGGCFWCMEEPFDELEGVISTTSGYTGGNVVNPSYKQVSAGNTGHAESVEIEYDADKVSYEQLLDVFWHNVDPTVKNKQFCDVGNQYRTAIFYHDDQQKALAQNSKEKVSQELATNIYTEITPAQEFYPAEDYHQNYYQTNTLLYKFYRSRCGRDRRLQEVWGN
ncbi:peptide methionine sulfoxide reductase [Cyanobacterium stanieri PCC 7202]|uniref:Peptide methionine sulfoxide reductase MsrA n=1 Tax=Cyanobacterium stanieri (strain ATCC 29140 / PCC 7202) TaxID=292563 RepID=K9YP49_CYASC|nr:peptide methionine sulfoxide reductase [Cyanobacterium stanieri PCC 7202]